MATENLKKHSGQGDLSYVISPEMKKKNQGLINKIRCFLPMSYVIGLASIAGFLINSVCDREDIKTHANVFCIAQFSLISGLIGAVLLAALLMHRQNHRKTLEIQHLVQKLDSEKRQTQMAEKLLSTAGICFIVWDRKRGEEPAILGSMPNCCNIQKSKAQFLTFDSWMTPQSAAALQDATKKLRQNGKAFDYHAETVEHRILHVSGRINPQTIMYFQDITNFVEKKNCYKNKADILEKQLQIMQKLFDKIKQPIWLRDMRGDMILSNYAYRQADSPDESHELLADVIREKIDTEYGTTADTALQKKISIVIGGDRRVFDVTYIRDSTGSAGFICDKTENEYLHNELKRIVQGYSETFDQLSTAVAIFDPSMKLEFFNEAFASLWPLEPAFLESQPSHALVLDLLREKGILNEQPNWRQWKEELFEAYRALIPHLHIWNLPDGRTLRVVANPHPQGGVAWLYEDLTEKLNLEARYNTLIRMQGETLDNLSEGVVVFGANGKIKLSNQSFSRLWLLTPELGIEGTHISDIEAFCLPLTENNAWKAISASITGFADKRDCIGGRMDLRSGHVLDYSLVPLPQGQTMLTFVNVTDSVMVSRALQERNEALEFADRLRNDFVQHVSYKLRTPLTNIIGFTDLLRSPDFGKLNARQYDYLKHIAAESVILLNIVNDILDLATVDAGIMELDISKVNIAEVMRYAITRIKDCLSEKDIWVEQYIAPDLETFYADEARVRQVLVNLLSNAASFAPANSAIHFTACVNGKDVVFCIHDQGCGIPDDILDTVFKRFTAYAYHGRQPGAGLGLSIVKSFVELHQGTVNIDTSLNRGTTVICRFPLNALALHTAAV
ncbi:MAG: Histidine kinase [Candidatus Tokpelaia sp. JSC188]|nr:MAG: Histidine kinase [Candidatus Tokpelaia sp. JSC188]